MKSTQRIKVLATAGPRRQAVLPDVPTLTEQGVKNADATNWFGVVVPAATPRAIVDALNARVNEALASPDVRQRLEGLGLVIGGGTPASFAAFMKNETDRLRALIERGVLQRQ